MRFTSIGYVIILPCLHANALNQFGLEVIWETLHQCSVTRAILKMITANLPYVRTSIYSVTIIYYSLQQIPGSYSNNCMALTNTYYY